MQAIVQLRQRGGEVERAVFAARAHVLHVGGGLGQAGIGGGQERDLGVGIVQQRQVGEAQTGGDDAGQRLFAEAVLAAGAAGVGIAHDRAVALGAHGAGAGHDGVHEGAQPVEEGAVGGV